MENDVALSQEEIGQLANEVEGLLERIRSLGQRLDQPLTEEQVIGLEPEPLSSHVSAFLRFTEDVSLEEVVPRLRSLVTLQQEDLDEDWQAQLPTTVASEVRRRTQVVCQAADAVFDARGELPETAPVTPAVLEALGALTECLDTHSDETRELGKRCRRYLTERRTLNARDDE